MYHCPECEYRFERPMWSIYGARPYHLVCPACGCSLTRSGRLGALLVAIVAVTLAAQFDIAPPDLTPEATVAVSRASVREDPTETARVLTTAERGDSVKVFFTARGWTEVQYADARGYIPSDLLDFPRR